MKMKLKALAAIVTLLGAAPVAQAAPVIVDGNLTDWGVAAALGHSDGPLGPNTLGNATPAAPKFGLTNYTGVTANLAVNGGFIQTGMIEDSRDDKGDYTLGPVQGGQPFDAETLLVGRDAGSSMYYVAIMSGQLPMNGNRYEPGDLGIEVRRGNSYSYYGIELGGGAGTGISATNAGSNATGTHYNINTNGYTTNVTKAGVAGGIYATALNGAAGNAQGWTPGIAQSVGNPNGNYPINGTNGIEVQLNVATLNNANLLVGQATMARQYMTQIFSGTTYGHEMLELSFDSSNMFQDGDMVRFWWAPSCGNDVLVTPLFENVVLVPEPATLALAGLGAASLVVRRNRRRGA